VSATTLDGLYAEFLAASEDRKAQARETLVMGMYREAWPIIWSKLHGAHPDIVADSVSKAALNLDKFRGEARFSTWFYKIVMSFCNTVLRAKLLKPTEISLEQLAEEGAEPIIEVENADNAKIELTNLLEKLDATDRKLIALKAEGKTYPEIAEALGLKTTDAAHSRWRRLTARIEREKQVQDARFRLVAGSAAE
jgi:RNA polymerase sigma factor (sigma-70 family)